MTILYDGRAVLMGKEEINLDNFPALKVIGVNMTGTEHLPWRQINERGIKVLSLIGETEFLKSVTSTSEHTIGLMLALARKYKHALSAPYGERNAYTGHTLRGKVLGLVGCGRVSHQVADIAEAFGMKVLVYDTSMDYNVYDWATSIEVLCKKSDFVSLHIPLAENEQFFTIDMFRKMRSTAYFINTSRPGIVQKGALREALSNQYIAGAAVDFIDDLDLLSYSQITDRLILTNHMGGNTFEDRKATEEFILAKLNNYFQSL